MIINFYLYNYSLPIYTIINIFLAIYLLNFLIVKFKNNGFRLFIIFIGQTNRPPVSLFLKTIGLILILIIFILYLFMFIKVKLTF